MPAGGTVRYAILGPVEVRVDGELLPLRSPRQRNLLAALLLNQGRVVPTGRLVELLWGDTPPRTAPNAVRQSVSQLRGLLGEPAVLTRDHGYLLEAGPGQSDLAEFDELLRQAGEADGRGRTAEVADRLRRALALWRGAALADVTAERLRRCYLPRLEQRRRAALADYRRAKGLLAPGNGGPTGPVLETLRRLMPADDPQWTESVPEAERAPRPYAPRQLPPEIADFIGHDTLLAELVDRLGQAAADPNAPAPVVAIVGKPGVGKSALAVRCGHRVSEWYPDGQLHARLRGPDGRPRELAEILTGWLRALGTPAAECPTELAGLLRCYRDLLAGSRVLLVLDDAVDETQVRPLLPTTPGSAALVTSRTRMPGLAATRPVVLDTLSTVESVQLLEQIVGPERVGAEPVAAERIAAYCGELPLAVRIAGERLTLRRYWPLSHLADRMDDERYRLDELRAGQQGVRSSVVLSYDALDAPYRRAFRLLGLLGGDTVPAWTAALLLGTSTGQAGQILARLADRSLLDPVGGNGTGQVRYRRHPLLKLFAQERLQVEETVRARQAADDRLLAGYLHLTDQLVDADRRPDRAGPPPDQPPPVVLADPATWFDAERDHLIDLLGRAAVRRPATAAWQLAVNLAPFLARDGAVREWEWVAELLLAAVRRDGDAPGEAQLIRALDRLPATRASRTGT